MLKRKLLVVSLAVASALSTAACTTTRDYSARAGTDIPGGTVGFGYGGEGNISMTRENSTPSVYETRSSRNSETAFPAGSYNTSPD